jgi:Tol biopolymer transport system component
VTDNGHNQVVHLAEDGTELLRKGGLLHPAQVSVNPTDGSCWITLWVSGLAVVHLAADGAELSRTDGFHYPYGIAVDPVDGSCWVGDHGNDQVVHLSEAGAELLRLSGFDEPNSVSVDPSDGSCWVADKDNGEVVHLAADGTELWRGPTVSYPLSVSVDEADGSCWVADWSGHVAHLSEGGVALWQGPGFDAPRSASVDSTNGWCWVADTGNNEVVRLSVVPDGKVLFSGCMPGDLYGPELLVADADFSNVVRLTRSSEGPGALPECLCPGCDFGEWSPDGSQIALERNYRLTVMDLSALIEHPGQEPSWLLDEYDEPILGRLPTWSPDGLRIAYVGHGFVDPPWGLCVVDADGTGQQLLVPAWGNMNEPKWSPDGSRIVFREGPGGNERCHLWLAEGIDDPGGPTVRQLTSNPDYMERQPSWSPDGSRVVFTRGIWDEPYGGPGVDVWTIDVDTGVETQLTATPGVGERPIGWSPLDGLIYFTENHAAVCRILPDGSGRETVRSSPPFSGATYGSWMPTGVWIDGLNALPGESVTPKIGIVDAESLAGSQAWVRYTGCCETLSLDSVLLGDSISDWVMLGPSVGPDVASFLAYAPDPGTQSLTGSGHLFDVDVTNDPAAQPGDTQLLTFDDLRLSDDWGDPLERIALGGGVRTIPFASLEISAAPDPVCADPDDPIPFPVTITARDRVGAVMLGCDASLQLDALDAWAQWPMQALPIVSPTSVALVDGVWSGDLTLTEARPELIQVRARWEEMAAFTNWVGSVGKADPNMDYTTDIFDVVKIANMAIDRGTWEDWQLWSGDLNGDDVVDVLDVTACAEEAMGAMAAVPTAARAAAAPGESEPVVVTTSTASTKTETTLAVELSDCTGLAGIQVELAYDASTLSYAGMSAGELLTGTTSWALMDNDKGGVVKAIAYTAIAETLSGDEGTILLFTFDKLGKKPGKAELTSVTLSAPAGVEILSQIGRGKGGGKDKDKKK